MIEVEIKNDPLAQAAMLTAQMLADEYARGAAASARNALQGMMDMRAEGPQAREILSLLAGHAIGLVVRAHEAAVKRIEEDDALQGGGL